MFACASNHSDDSTVRGCRRNDLGRCRVHFSQFSLDFPKMYARGPQVVSFQSSICFVTERDGARTNNRKHDSKLKLLRNKIKKFHPESSYHEIKHFYGHFLHSICFEYLYLNLYYVWVDNKCESTL